MKKLLQYLEDQKEYYMLRNRGSLGRIEIGFFFRDLLNPFLKFNSAKTVILVLPYPKLKDDISGWVRKNEKSLLDI